MRAVTVLEVALPHKSFLAFSVIAATSALAAFPAAAARLVLDAPGDVCFSLAVPAGWFVEAPPPTTPEDDPELPRIVSLYPDPEQQVWLGMWHARLIGSLDEAKERFDDLQGFVFDKPEMTEETEVTIAGFPGFRTLGTAVSDGEPVTFGIVAFEYAPDAVGVGVYVGEDDSWQLYAPAVQASLDSVRVEDSACR